MSKLIFSTGKVAEKPYEFSCSRVKLYSMDELNYFLYHNIYLISGDIFDQSLADWIRSELELPEVADKLSKILPRRNNVKDIVISLLCSADYYTESEIRALIQIIDQIERLPLVKKKKIKADNYLALGQYAKALREYESILNSTDSAVFTQVEYGDIYHNLAVTKSRTVSIVEASKYFLLAFKRNNRQESRKSYLYSLLLSNNEADYKHACEELCVSKEEQDEIEEAILEQEVAALEQPAYKKIEELDKKDHGENAGEFYKNVSLIIEKYKENYRKGIVE